MHIATRFMANTGGLAMLLLAGCTWYPYSPYSGGYYGPTYAPPGGYVAPGPTYVPQNSAPILNGTGSPTPLNSTTPASPKPNWQTPSNDAPLFNNPVPNPRDPDFGTPPAAAVLPRPPALAARPQFPEAASVQPAGLHAADPFYEPARIATDANAQPMPTNSVPYAFDGAGYKWLKGIVDFDEDTKTWAIIYSLTPEANDRFGGTFWLGPSEQLGTLQDGDLMLLAGQPHATLKDNRGLPVYHVSKVTRLGNPDQQR